MPDPVVTPRRNPIAGIKLASSDGVRRNPIGHIRLASMQRRGLDLGAAAKAGVQDIGRIGLALPALGEHIVGAGAEALGLTVPEVSTPFSNTLGNMAAIEADEARMAQQGMAPPSVGTQILEGATRSGIGMAPSLALAPAAGANLGARGLNLLSSVPGGLSTFGNSVGVDMNDPTMGASQRLGRGMLQAGLEIAGENLPMGKLGLGPEAALAQVIRGARLPNSTAGIAGRVAGSGLAEMGQEFLTGGAQSIADDLTDNETQTWGEIGGRALEDAAISAATALPVSASMSTATEGINGLRLRQEMIQQRRQQAAQAIAQAFAPAGAQRILDPATGETFTPAMLTRVDPTGVIVTKAQEGLDPVEITPDVIQAAQQDPTALDRFTTAELANLVNADQAEVADSIIPDAEGAGDAVRRAMEEADQTALGMRSLRAADDEALRQQLLREQVDNAIGSPRDTQAEIDLAREQAELNAPKPVDVEQQNAQKTLADQERVQQENQENEKRRTAFRVREDIRAAEAGTDVGTHAYDDSGKLTVDSARPNYFLSLPEAKRAKAIERARKFVRSSLGDDEGAMAADDPTITPEVAKFRMQQKPLPPEQASGVRTTAPAAEPTAEELAAMPPKQMAEAFRGLPAESRQRLQPQITSILQGRKRQQEWEKGLHSFNAPAKSAPTAAAAPQPQGTPNEKRQEGLLTQPAAPAAPVPTAGVAVDPASRYPFRPVVAEGSSAQGSVDTVSEANRVQTPMTGYLGGKRWGFNPGSRLYDVIPAGTNERRFIDAFGGSGIVGGILGPATAKHLVYNDLNPGNINFHNTVRSNPDAVAAKIREIGASWVALRGRLTGNLEDDQALANLWWREQRGRYASNANSRSKDRAEGERFSQELAAAISRDPIGAAAWWAIMNNGSLAVRGAQQKVVAKKPGEDATGKVADTQSFGRRADEAAAWGRRLAEVNAEVRSVDAMTLLNEAGAGDIINLDPPYVPEQDGMDVAGYAHGKDWENTDWVLANAIPAMQAAIRRGAKVMMTNYPNPRLVAALEGIGLRVEIHKKPNKDDNEGGAYELFAHNFDSSPRSTRAPAAGSTGEVRQSVDRGIPVGQTPGANAGERADTGVAQGGGTGSVPAATGTAGPAVAQPTVAPSATPQPQPQAQPAQQQPQAKPAPQPAQPSKELARLARIAKSVLPDNVKVEAKADHVAITYPGGATIQVRPVTDVPLDPAAWFDSVAKVKGALSGAFSRAGFGTTAPTKAQWLKLPKARQQAVMAEAPPVAAITDVGGRRVGISREALVRLVQSDRQSDSTVANAIEEEDHHFLFSALLTDQERTIVRDEIGKANPALAKEDPASRAVMEAAYEHWRGWNQNRQRQLTPRTKGVFRRLLDRIKQLLGFTDKVPTVSAKDAASIWSQLGAVRERGAATPGTTTDEGDSNALLVPKDESLRGGDLRRQWDKAHGQRRPQSKPWAQLVKESDEIDRKRGVEVPKDEPAYAVPRPKWTTKSQKLVSKLPPKGPSAQIRATLLNNGVNERELYWLGLDDLLKTKPVVTRDEVAALLADPSSQMREVVLGEGDEAKIEKAAAQFRTGAMDWGVPEDVAVRIRRRIANEPAQWGPTDDPAPSQDIDESEQAYATPRTIDVDGKQRSALNSDGKPIAQTDEQIRNFWRWFGDSKVVDEQGRPLVVYHGTNKSFDVFDSNKIGKSHGRSEGAGFYFTTSKETASSYADGGEPMSVYLSIENPIGYDAPGFRPAQLKKVLLSAAKIEAEREGSDQRDGFLANFGDTYSQGVQGAASEAARLIANDETALDQLGGIVGSGVPADIVNEALRQSLGFDGFVSNGFSNIRGEGGVIWVATDPTQIKSATGNRGTFDGTDERITYNTPQAINDVLPGNDRQTFAQWQQEAETILADEQRMADVRARAMADAGLSPAEQIALRRQVAEQLSEAATSGNKNRWTEALETAALRKAAGARVARELAARRLDLSTPEGRRELILNYTAEMGSRWQTAYDRAKERGSKRDMTAASERWAKQQEKIHRVMKDRFGIDLADPRLGETFGDAYSVGQLLDAISDVGGGRFHLGRLVGYYVAGNLLGGAAVAANTTGYPLMMGIQATKAMVPAITKLLMKSQRGNQELLSIQGASAAVRAGVGAMYRGLVNGALSVWTGRPQANRKVDPTGGAEEDFNRMTSPIKNPFLRVGFAPFLELNRFMDETAWTVGYSGALAAAATERKLAGDQRSHRELIDNPDQDMVEKAVRFADWFTLRGTGSKGADAALSRLSSIREASPQWLENALPESMQRFAVNPLYFVMPFFKTIAVLTMEGAKLAAPPVMAAVAAKRGIDALRADAKQERQEAAAASLKAAAYVIAGLALMGLTHMRGDDEDDYLVKGSPSDGKSAGERSMRYAVEKPRTIGGVDYSRLDPAAMPLSLHADFRDAMQEIQDGKPVGKALGKLGDKAWNAAIQRQFLTGVSGLFTTQYNEEGEPKSIPEKFRENVTSQLMPGRQYVSTYRRLTETQRMERPRGQVERAYDAGRPARNVFGETEKTREDTTGAAIAGLFFPPRGKASEEAQRWEKRIYSLNETIDEAGGRNWWPSHLSRSYQERGQTVRYTDEQYDRLREIAGRRWLALLNGSRALKEGKMTPAKELDLIRDLRETANHYAAGQVRRSAP
jgi:site-specific DNA-adenine methylase